MKYGVEGYGLYFYCLELIAREVTSRKYTFELEHDSELIAYNLKMDSKKVEEILIYCVNQGLFEINGENIITCFNMLKRLDDSTSKSPEIKKLIENSNFRKNSELVGKTPSRIEKKRIEENKKENNKKEYEIPSGINEGAFIEFETYRRGIRKKITKASANKLFKLLLEYDTNEQAEIINNSIMNSWQGLFPLKYKTVKQQTQTDRPLEQTTDFSFGQDIKL